LVLAKKGSSLPKQIKDVQGVKVLSFDGLNEESEGIISKYMTSVKDGKNWPRRPRLSVSHALSHQIKLLENIVSTKNKRTSL
jgi:hypothetical protein